MVRLEDKLDRYHEDTQRQLRELYVRPLPPRDGEARLTAVEHRLENLDAAVRENTRARAEAIGGRAVVTRIIAMASVLGAIAGVVIQILVRG